jgi:hypothetical protein
VGRGGAGAQKGQGGRGEDDQAETEEQQFRKSVGFVCRGRLSSICGLAIERGTS